MRGLFRDKSEAKAFNLFKFFISSTGTLLLLKNMSRFQNKRRRNSSSIGVIPVKDQCRGGHLFLLRFQVQFDVLAPEDTCACPDPS